MYNYFMIELFGIREDILNLIEFDLFASPQFLEAVALYFAQAKKVDDRDSPFDGVNSDGLKFEVKSSQIKPSGDNFNFRNVLGVNGAKLGKVDFYIFIAHDGEGELFMWVIPAPVVERYMIQKPYPGSVGRKCPDLCFKHPERIKVRRWYNKYFISPPQTDD